MSSTAARSYFGKASRKRPTAMPAHTKNVLSRILAACALCAVVLLLPAAARASEPYGELTRFGEGGNGIGQLNDEENKRVEGTLRTHLIGVDPTDNSVYVLDEPKEAEQKRKKPTKAEEEECAEEEVPLSECGALFGPITREFRIQKFTSEGGKYHATTSVQFKEVSPEGSDQTAVGTDIEGIAVDPASKRVYVLAVDVRQRKIGVDERGPAGNVPVAGTLFAFESNKEGNLVPAGKSGTAVLTGPGESELAAQSTTPGRALLQPTGITVDPGTGDIVILAHEDPSGAAFDVPVNEESATSPDHFVAQRVLPSGALASGPGARWRDTTNFFHTGGFGGLPNSPVVVGPAGTEALDVQYEGRIAQIPGTFESPAEYVYSLPTLFGAAEGRVNYLPRGGALSATPSSSEGNLIYAPTYVENEQPKAGGFAYGAVMRMSAPSSVSMLGWAGAQNLVAERGAGEPKYDCVLEPAGGGPVTPVAAGKEGKVFVLALGFIEKTMLENREETTYPGSPFPAIVELGPGGSGCPLAKAGQLSAEISGVPVGEREISKSEAVTFSSYVNQADAREVRWNFGDGTTETVTKGFKCPASAPSEYRGYLRQCPAIEHAFSKSGKLTVTETVYTDDLSTPEVALQTTVNVAGEGGKEEEGGKEKEGGKEEGGGGKEEGGGGRRGPTAVLIGPVGAAPSEPVGFDGSASSDPAARITEYHWHFGDGSEATSTVPTATHSYAKPGEYMPSLTVTDALGNTSAPSRAPSPVVVAYRSSSGGGPAATIASSTPAPSGNVGGFTSSEAPQPIVTLSEALAVVDSHGRLTLKLHCPTGETSCAGQLNLRAVIAAGTRRGAHKKKSGPSTLASGSFALPGGTTKSVVLRVSSKVRAALARRRRLIAQLTILAHDPAGASHTTRLPVVVTAAAARRHH